MILWTDSKCVLHWLQSKKMISDFIQRRVDEIKSSGDTDFRYAATHDILEILHQEEWIQRNYKSASYGGMVQAGGAKTKITGQCGTFINSC